jgi:hypothetical protein
LRKIREENFQTAIGFMMDKPKHPKVILLKNRRHKNRLTQKPINSNAEDNVIQFRAKSEPMKEPVNSSAEDNLVQYKTAV